ncbi:MAG: hypothetical protein ACKVP3_09225 [Hyphomicrobiaceae bacterium]
MVQLAGDLAAEAGTDLAGRIVIDQLLVPTDTAGCLVRVRTALPTEEFYLVAVADEAEAANAASARDGAVAGEAVEGVGFLSAKAVRENRLRPGQIKPARDAIMPSPS